MAAQKFKKGNCVIYGSSGMCFVSDIKALRPSLEAPSRLYYVLSPAGDPNSKIFVPTENKTLTGRMRFAMTKSEVDSLLAGAIGKEISWIDDRTARTNFFHEILNRGMEEDLLLMIRCLFERKRELQKSGKKLSGTDDDMLKTAEKFVKEEFSYSLEIPQEKVEDYIRSAMEKQVG